MESDPPAEASARGDPPGPAAGWIPAAAAAAAACALLLFLGPDLWLRDAVPALTDLPGHLLPVVLLRDQLIPSGQLQGWTFDWFAGFPLYRFYFPLPGLLAAALSVPLGDLVALRLVAMAPVVLLPVALWAFGRLGRVAPIPLAGIVVLGSSAALMTSHGILGGNVTSVVGGEFSYAWSLLFVLIHLGALSAPAESRGAGVVAGLALAAALLSHILPVMAVVLGMVPFLVIRARRQRIIGAWLLAGVVSAFWFVPMALSVGQTASRGWSWAPDLLDLVPLEILLVLPPAALGALRLRRQTAVWALVSVGAVSAVLGFVPQEMVMRGRFLPIWYLAVHALAGFGVVDALRRGVARGPGRWWLVAGTVGAACWILLLASRGIERDPWIAGIRGVPALPGAAELDSLRQDLRRLPPGRIHWEPGEVGLARWGGKEVLALLPYWTDHSVLGGLLAESAPISQFVYMVDAQLDAPPRDRSKTQVVLDLPWDPARAVDRLRFLGVRYLLTHTPETTAAVASSGPAEIGGYGALRLFDLGEEPLVTALPCWEVVPAGPGFRDYAETWFLEWRPGSTAVIGDLRGGSAERGCDSGDRPATDVEFGEGRIRFRTASPGVPHLLRVSYFPDWRARGADGPYLAAPWFMVVVPDGEEVELFFATALSRRLGSALTLLGIVGLAVLGIAGARRRRLSGPSPAGRPGLAPPGGVEE